MFCAGASAAFALKTTWQPFERPAVGQPGTGAHEVVNGMSIYSTPPARSYVVIGLINASNGLFGSPRTRAVTAAKKAGADALLLINSDQYVSGTTGDAFSSKVHYRVVAHYAALRFADAGSSSTSNGCTPIPASDRVEPAPQNAGLGVPAARGNASTEESSGSSALIPSR